ncbi:MAG: hypothetical protein WBW92_02245 [Rhodanobacteraceae bacterium]
MNCRKTLLAAGVATAMFAVSSAGAVTLQSSHPTTPHAVSFPNATTASVLYDQTDNASGNGAPAQNFETAYDAYDSEGADDFVVPAGGWTLTEADLVTSTSGPFTGTTTATVNIYPDAAGQPGASPVCSFPGATATVGAATTTIPLTGGCSLGAGTYWLAVQIDLDLATNGQIFWSDRSTQSNSAGVWRNPNDGFGSGCTNWDTLANCGVGGSFPDYLFQLVGNVGGGLPPYTPVPTIGQWGAGLGVAGLALLGLFGLRRRRAHS